MKKACRNCGSDKYYTIVTTYTDKGTFDECSECSDVGTGSLGRGSNDIVGIATTPSGEEVALNNKGNIVENKYKNDNRGWKRAGYGTKGYERTILHKPKI